MLKRYCHHALLAALLASFLGAAPLTTQAAAYLDDDGGTIGSGTKSGVVLLDGGWIGSGGKSSQGEMLAWINCGGWTGSGARCDPDFQLRADIMIQPIT